MSKDKILSAHLPANLNNIPHLECTFFTLLREEFFHPFLALWCFYFPHFSTFYLIFSRDALRNL